MNKHNQLSGVKKGFTIIEVVLVLAIAGLIFLMVFIALPALQGAQRDTQRKNDLSRISTQISDFQASSRGKVPTSATLTTFVSKYLGANANNACAGDEYVDPTGPEESCDDRGYRVTFRNTNSSTIPVATVYYADESICSEDGSGNIVTSGSGVSPRNYTLRIALEGQKVPYCLDNK